MLHVIASADGGSGVVTGLIVGSIIWAVLTIAGWWKIFEKADEPGWAAIVPFYNAYVMLRIVGRPGWMVIGFFIPFVNVILYVIVMGNLAKSFGKGFGFVLGLILLNPLFSIILGFGESRYIGPTAEQGQRY